MKESTMYQAIKREGKDEGREEGLEEGLEQGKQQEREIIARNMLISGVNHEQVVQFTGLSLERVQQLQQEREFRLKS